MGKHATGSIIPIILIINDQAVMYFTIYGFYIFNMIYLEYLLIIITKVQYWDFYRVCILSNEIENVCTFFK